MKINSIYRFCYVLSAEVLESILRRTKILARAKFKCSFLEEQLSKDGISLRADFLSNEQCLSYISKIDDILNSGDASIWIDDTGADHRIYFAEELDDTFKHFYDAPEIRAALLEHTGISEPKGMILASKIIAKKGNIGSGGGWHRDSPITHQFKAICYLNDVDKTNGPFQFIKQSHRKGSVLKAYFKGILSLGAFRFSDRDIEDYKESFGANPYSVEAPAGSLIFVDTKGIHRGTPLIDGQRYALFCYFWDKQIPAHFEKLRQRKK